MSDKLRKENISRNALSMTKEEDCKTIPYIPGRLLVIVSHCDGRDGSHVEGGWEGDGNQRRAHGDTSRDSCV